MQRSNFKKGDLFRYNKGMSIHDDVHGHLGVVLAPINKFGQYKVQVSHKTLWVTLWSMEEL
jgi:hypothetical protein